jgi:CRP-like cAMP-binding protein
MSVTPPDGVSAELSFLLNQAVLTLSTGISMKQVAPDRMVVKNEAARLYLIFTPVQWEILQRFKRGATVPFVLCELMAEQYDPQLRELYELVVKCARAGVLQAEGYPPPPRVDPLEWPVGLPGVSVRWLATAAFVAVVVSIALHRPQPPAQPFWYLAGWALAGVAASLGSLLAAAVVKSGGGVIYGLRWEFRTLLPRLEAGLDDALLGGRPLAANAALALLLPHFVLLAAAAWVAPALQLPLILGTLAVMCPFWASPLHALLSARYREMRLATDDFRVVDAGGAPDRLRVLLGDRRFMMAWLVSALLWTALALVILGALLPESLLTRLGWASTDAGLHHVLQLAGLVLGLALVLGVLGATGWFAWRLYMGWKERAERQLRPAAVLVSPQTIAEWLGRTVLFRDLPATELEAVAAAVRPEEHRRGSYVVREGEAGERLYIVLSGRLEVRRDFAPGRSEPVAEMGEGDVFGEIALLEGGIRTRSVRSLERSVLLALDKADFERLVLSKVSRQAVAEAVQKVGFLDNIRLTRGWDHATLGAFARQLQGRELTEGTVVLEQGRPNQWFCILHRGEVAVRVNGQEVRRLKAGETFGELSLLRAGTATADVVVTSRSASVLVIAARDFLDFVAKDFTVGLAWAGARKGRRVK